TASISSAAYPSMAARGIGAISSYAALAARFTWSLAIVAPRLRKKSRLFRPISTMRIDAPPCSAMNRCAPLIRLELKAPARPLSLVIRINRIGFPGRFANSGCFPASSSDATAAATFDNTLRSNAPYGREAITRSCARRSFAAETIFMALVICWVFFTDRMRRRISIRLGMGGGRQLRYEPGLELLDGRSQLGAQRVVQRLLGPDIFEDRTMRVVHQAVKLLLKLPADFHWQIVQIPLRAGEDNYYLLFQRERLILSLLENFHQVFPSIELIQ